MKKDTKITSDGIRKVLKNYTPATAFAEYVWNGYDAKATRVNISYEHNALGVIDELSIYDNGTGINVANLADKFEKFYDSEKAIDIKSPKHSSILHGRNGVGRLTFFTFANNAEWETTYIDLKGSLQGGKILIDASNLQSYNPVLSESVFPETGTIVKFKNLKIFAEQIEKEILPFLYREISWFLELNRNISFEINGQPIDYEGLVSEREQIYYEFEGIDFNVNYIQWDVGLNKEQSKFYYLDSWGKEVYKEFTSLNRQGDKFYHSVYVQSSFFDDFVGGSELDDAQQSIFANTKGSKAFRFLSSELNKYLRSKKRPLLREYGESLVSSFEKSGVLPDYKNPWEKYRLTELKEVIVGLYEVQPKIFVDLNIEQKKILVKFLDLLLDSNERDKVFEILNDITTLTSDELESLSSLLKSTKMNRIVSTVKLIEDRYRVFYHLQALVYREELNANELVHLQTMIENHYWIFGEQYSLVTAAEPNFEEALRRYTHYLKKEYDDKGIAHPDKLMAMDIFMCRQEKQIDKIHNVVVELKHPTVKLGETQLNQVKKYMGVLLSQDEFNASNMSWDFILVGDRFNTLEEIENALENAKNHGERSLVFKAKNYKIYVKTWAEVFAEFEIKHQFIDVKLKLEKANLISAEKTANATVIAALNNSAIGEGEMSA